MNWGRTYSRLFRMGLITLVLVFIVIGITYLFLKRSEGKLIEHRKNICEERAARIARLAEGDEEIQNRLGILLQGDTINLASTRVIEEILTETVKRQVHDTEGLEGGFYVVGLDDFLGYAFPTSEPPVPAYGPPPRSYNIIRDQVIASMARNRAMIDLHAFDPAIFPLATCPFKVNGQIAGAVWVRIHIERDLPVARLRRVLSVVTVILGAGFLIMALFILFLRSGIRSIQQELIDTRTNPGYRLNQRGGMFGFIPKQINEMLDLIENEYKQRLELEKQLHHKEKLASLGKMIAGVAHEVRTPLSVIKTRLQMWETEIKKDNRKELELDSETISMVINEINRVSDLMKRLVVFSRPIYENLKPTSLKEVIEEVLSMMVLEIPGKEIRIIRKLQDDPYLVNSDPNSLKQVFINIITNAMESLADNGLIIVETGYDPEARQVTLTISDNGSGIDEDIQQHIFDPFYTTKESGTGLGLAISREIIISHGGQITFHKNEPLGTICFITLPVSDEKS